MKELNYVFVLAPDCHQVSGYYRLLWTRHFPDGIRPWVQRLILPEDVDFSWARQGHDIDLTPFAAARARSSEQLLEQIKSSHRQHGLDAVISYCFGFDVEPGVVKETVRMGVPWVNFFCDSTHMFEKVEALARVVSLNWFPETAAIERYEALGVPYLCQPYAMNPGFLPDLTCQVSSKTVGFIGLPTANRITQLGWLRLFGCPVEIRGHGWVSEERSPFYSAIPKRKRFIRAMLSPNLSEKILRRAFWPSVRSQARGPLDDGEFNVFVKRCLVMLGLNQGKDTQGRFASYLKFRDVEFPGYGCCYLTEHNEGVAAAFEVGKEILTYRNMREAAEHIRRIQTQTGLAAEIGLAARRRVLENHTWEVRLKQIAARL